MRSILLVTAGLALTGLLPAQVVSTPAQPIPPTSPTSAIATLQQYLSLTDSQVSALLAIQQQQQTALSQLYTQLDQDQQTLQTLLQAANPNALSVGQTMIEIQNLENQIAQTGISQYQTQALAVLTPAQLTLLGNLNTALQLQATAYQAVSVFLLTAPTSVCSVASLGVPLPTCPPVPVTSGLPGAASAVRTLPAILPRHQ